ncbi:MAG: 16S rRNA (adenine(1518)-N(6)/adenine(1519)-N(6))-dimethyltransferase RsmA [Coriobacteriia bacterium]|nr:16S rRNA (adenine(1518)-N(6)/adenine(1519)-N(6))-dimethyltransferase RsmA [Coriobacteriia bacterium]
MPSYSPHASPAATIAMLKRYGLNTKKSLGQHFIVDDGVIGKTLRLAGLDKDSAGRPPSGLPIVEVGPGIGTLTEALLRQGASVTAIELDERLQPVLADLEKRYPGRFAYIMQDALLLQPADLPAEFDIVANLPYSIAATLILDFYQRFAGLGSATVMVQNEVAMRIMAKPASKDYGAYTVKLAMIATYQASFSVARTSFLPPPRVDSRVVRLQRSDGLEDTQADNVEKTRLVVDAAFAERRKTLRNSLISNLRVNGSTPEQIDQALLRAGIDGQRRAESLALDEFKGLIGGFWPA